MGFALILDYQIGAKGFLIPGAGIQRCCSQYVRDSDEPMYPWSPLLVLPSDSSLTIFPLKLAATFSRLCSDFIDPGARVTRKSAGGGRCRAISHQAVRR